MAKTASSKQEFLRSEMADSLRQELQAMVDDPQYNTRLRYSVLAIDGEQFVAKHMEYMSNHLQMNPKQYVSNLRLMTKLKVLK